MKVLFLSGGRGTPKLIEGFRSIVRDEAISVIVNTADDEIIYGLYISPDVDTIVYLFSNQLDTEKYWGIKGDTFNFMKFLRRLLEDSWFNLGDRDLAMHIFRTIMIQRGLKLSEVTKIVCRKLGVKSKIMPMTDSQVRTRVITELGELSFQEFHVKYRDRPQVYSIKFEGLSEAKPSEGVVEAIEEANILVIGPSNPINSIGPILGVRGIREAICRSRAVKVAVSPLVKGRPFSGPADKFMRACGLEVSSLSIANLYKDLIDYFVLDFEDDVSDEDISDLGVKPVRAKIYMGNADSKIRLAKLVLSLMEAKN